MRTLCVILARAGSKGLPGKNVADLAGRPLIAHTIAHAKAARKIDRIVVSTDGDAIAQAARAAEIEVIPRPANLAGDTATVDSAARQAVLAAEETVGHEYDAVVILYANVPLRPMGLIDRSLDKLAATGCDSVQSVYPVGKTHPYWMKRLVAADGGSEAASGSGAEAASGSDNDVLEHYQPNHIFRRQDLPPVFMLDGGIIAVRRASLFTVKDGQPHAFLGSDRRAVVTQPGEVVDIDCGMDLQIARAMLATNRAALPATFSIRGRAVGKGQPAYVIAELGVNHDGSLDLALALTRAASEAGADAVKLQLFDPRLLLSRQAALAEYQKSSADDVFAMLNALQISVGAMAAVRELAHERGMAFIVTPFSVELAGAMRMLDVDAVKIASPDAVNLPLIEAMLPLAKPMLISTGTCSFDELAPTAQLLHERASRDLSAGCLLHCVSAYPVAMQHADLARITRLGERFGLPVGYSDHTTQLISGALAVSQGACIVERHLTYDRGATGPDHAASLDPGQFAEYVRMVRDAEAAFADARREAASGEAASGDAEAEVRRLSRQSVCACRPLKAGHVIRREDVTVKRPGTGIPAAKLHEVIGRRVRRDVPANELLQCEDLHAPAMADAPLSLLPNNAAVANTDAPSDARGSQMPVARGGNEHPPARLSA